MIKVSNEQLEQLYKVFVSGSSYIDTVMVAIIEELIQYRAENWEESYNKLFAVVQRLGVSLIEEDKNV